MTIKTSELIGPALDWAVAMAEGKKVLAGPPIRVANIYKCQAGEYEVSKPYSPSTDWALMGPIIEREEMTIEATRSGLYTASIWNGKPGDFSLGTGQSHLIAAARCYVTMKLGREGKVPEELKIVGQKA